MEHRRMRTNIEIDDALLAAAMRASGQKTKRATVEEGLRLLVKLRRQKRVDRLFGKLRWEGDLERSRLDRGAG
jgi:Arc/MetJ family transcription regulator